MLASITPFGERSRGFSWRLTASAFAVGSISAGAVAGAAAGALGLLLPAGSGWRWIALIAVVTLTLLFDASPFRRWLPSSRRQVNENWLGRYRGWVYGLGFGAQLGVGVATIVTSATIYATAVVALLARGPAAGAAIGATFGAVRALALLPARSATDRDGLISLHSRLRSWDAPSRQAAYVVELMMLVAVIGWIA